MEGKVLQTTKAVNGPGVAREDWQIIRALSEVCGKALDYDTHSQVVSKLKTYSPVFNTIDELPSSTLTISHYTAKEHLIKSNYPQLIKNFYQTDVISRASKTMAQCTQELLVNSHLESNTTQENQLQ